MTRAQQVHYRKRLWPAACAAQGWDVKDEDRRRDVTRETTGQDSTSGLTNKQVDRLFRRLEWLANPGDFDAAYADANPELAGEEAERARITWRIRHTAERAGLTDAYLDQVAQHKCRRHHCQTWQQLPTPELLNLSRTIASRAKGRSAGAVQETCNTPADGIDMPF